MARGGGSDPRSAAGWLSNFALLLRIVCGRFLDALARARFYRALWFSHTNALGRAPHQTYMFLAVLPLHIYSDSWVDAYGSTRCRSCCSHRRALWAPPC